MRTIEECLELESSMSMTKAERFVMRGWLDSSKVRLSTDPYEYCCLLGWFVLDDSGIPLSPKEAGFD